MSYLDARGEQVGSDIAVDGPGIHPSCNYLAYMLSDGGYFCTKCGWAWSPAKISAMYLEHQRVWSVATFGPGSRLAGVIDHIREELEEVEECDGADISEWADVLILAFDGAMREGHTPQEVIDAIVAKQTKNESRAWPDWRTQPLDKKINAIKPASLALAEMRRVDL